MNDGDFEELCNGSGLRDSDTGEGCYIATAVYGSYDCPQVWALRRFRDDRLKRSAAGRGLIRLYYAVSPSLIAKWGHVRWLRVAARKCLDALVAALRRRGYQDAPYHDR